MAEPEQVAPELSALRDNLVKYEIATAQDRISMEEVRQRLDILVVTWRDITHAFLQQTGYGDPVLLHKVIDNMDEFLNRSKGRRK